MPEIPTCECVGELPPSERLAALYCAFKQIADGGGGGGDSVRNIAEIFDPHAEGLSDGVATLGTYQHRARVFGATSGKSVKVVFGNFQQCPDVTGANAITISASIDDGSGLVPLTFSGSASASIAAGTIIESDAVTVATPDFVTVRSCPQVTSGQKWPVGMAWSSVYGGGFTTGQNLTTAGSGAVGAGVGFGFGPLAIIATSALPSVIIRGDSIAVGTGDSVWVGQEQYFGAGWLARALTNTVPFVRWAKSSSFITTHSGANNVYSKLVYPRHSYGINESGVNDLASSAATIQAALLALWVEMKANGVSRVAQSTITPSGANNATRIAVNAYIRSLPSPLDYVIEAADAAETARDSGIWKVGYSDDNLHPNATGHAAIAAAVGTALLADINL